MDTLASKKKSLLLFLISLAAIGIIGYLVINLTFEWLVGPQGSGYAVGLAINPIEWIIFLLVILMIGYVFWRFVRA